MDPEEIVDQCEYDEFEPQSIFSSPIQGIHLSEQHRDSQESPSEVTIQFSHSIKKI